MKFTKGTFKKTYMNSQTEVAGYVSEHFGIDKVGRVGWAVTHLISGLRVVPYYFKTKQNAIEGMKELFPFLPEEVWATPEPFKDLTIFQRDELVSLVGRLKR